MPLNFVVFSITNRSDGGDPGYAVGDLLEDQQRDFGSAVQTIQVTLHHEGKVDKSIGAGIRGPMGIFASITSRLSDWPPHEGKRSVRFERKRSRLLVDYVATRVSPNEAFGCSANDVTRDLLLRAFDDVIEALDWALAERLKPSDDFDCAAFMEWMQSVRDTRYASEKALREQIEAASQRCRERYKSLDPWDMLDIDWDSMHTDARAILDRPRDWSRGHEFAPHGNDAGADIFADWEQFKDLTLEDAGTRMELPPLSDNLPNYLWKEWVDVHLAVAFGHIKHDGVCPPEIAQATIDLLQREQQKSARRRWKKRDEWHETLTRYKAILQKQIDRARDR